MNIPLRKRNADFIFIKSVFNFFDGIKINAQHVDASAPEHYVVIFDVLADLLDLLQVFEVQALLESYHHFQ